MPLRDTRGVEARGGRRAACVAGALWALLSAALCSTANAQRASVGEGPDALPAAFRVPMPVPAQSLLAASATAGYGYTEPVLDGRDQHHRAFGTVALALRPLPWLGFALRFDGRYDAHSTAQGPDDGLVGEPRLMARVAGRLGSLFGLGGQLTLWAPGAAAPSLVAAALSTDFELFGGFVPARGPVSLVARAGFRADQSAASAPDAARYSRSDRLALGVSSFHAVLVGVALSARIGPVEPLLEWSWDVLVGAGAPPPAVSPMHIVVGARLHPLSAQPFALGLLCDASPSARPSLDAGAPLVPAPPRVAVLLTLSVAFPAGSQGPSGAAAVRRTALVSQVVVPQPGRAAGRVLDPAGGPVRDAAVTVRSGTRLAAEARTDAEGRWSIGGLEAGEYQLTVRTGLGAERSAVLRVEPGVEARSDAVIEGAVVSGAQLRGQARAYDGAGVAVSVRIVELEQRFAAGGDGAFRLPIAPGAYTVEFSAEGYETQRRRVAVERDGVVIVNVDLRRRHQSRSAE